MKADGVVRHFRTLTSRFSLMLKRAPDWLWLSLFIGAGLFLGYLYLDVNIRDSYSTGWRCTSSAEARQRGLLLQEYVVEPHIVDYQNYHIEFTDCWVEEKTKTEHDFIFFEKVTKLNEFRLVLNYKGQRLTPELDSARSAMLVRDDEGMGIDVAESEYSDDPFRLAYHQFEDNPPFKSSPYENNLRGDTMYFSIIRGWRDKRNYSIKVYPKK